PISPAPDPPRSVQSGTAPAQLPGAQRCDGCACRKPGASRTGWSSFRRGQKLTFEGDHCQTGFGRTTAFITPIDPRPFPCLSLVLHGQDPVSDGQHEFERQHLKAVRTLLAYMVVVGRLAADHTAERHETIE